MDYFLNWYINLIKKAEAKIYQLEEHYGLKKHCYKGCDDCCYQQIDLYPYELFSINHYLKRKNISHLVKSNISPPTTENKYQYYLQRSPCIFLHQGACLVHEVRPISCLNYFSLRECSPINKLIHPNINYSYHEVEDFITTQVAFFMKENTTRYLEDFYESSIIKLVDYIKYFE